MSAPASREPNDDDDAAWLEARERGAELPPLDGARAAAYQRLTELLNQMPDEATPAEWKAEMIAAIKTGELPAEELDDLSRRRGRWRWLAAAAAGVAAAAAVLLWMRRPLPLLPSDEITVEIVRGRESRGGSTSTAALGDTLQLTVRDRGTTELRIYRDERELVMRCPGDPGCARHGRQLFARLPLTAPGRYRALTLEPAPRQAPSGSMVDDLKTCRCTIRPAPPVEVR